METSPNHRAGTYGPNPCPDRAMETNPNHRAGTYGPNPCPDRAMGTSRNHRAGTYGPNPDPDRATRTSHRTHQAEQTAAGAGPRSVPESCATVRNGGLRTRTGPDRGISPPEPGGRGREQQLRCLARKPRPGTDRNPRPGP
ncbi:hypothetical protein GCM10010168_54170 [Actinoplanes ianthinogenes]|uniref:Uncharacterized protein n=1 Tax=Actinoplanes ianthinogenes TaxID=122358 RepID=A0ABN6C856_9ACTN|nr:hypothetical protein Aiant_22420 [Actinoplanes ianthinogenes]GGR29124.1 hypothetical protein GCM10010168_54170 [Actinoplanes ianthinogenes]